MSETTKSAGIPVDLQVGVEPMRILDAAYAYTLAYQEDQVRQDAVEAGLTQAELSATHEFMGRRMSLAAAAVVCKYAVDAVAAAAEFAAPDRRDDVVGSMMAKFSKKLTGDDSAERSLSAAEQLVTQSNDSFVADQKKRTY